MKRVAVLGAGFVTKPAVDYLLDKCGYRVFVTSLMQSEAETLIDGRPAGRAIALSVEQTELLDPLVEKVDLVLSMIPPSKHLPVAHACIRHAKNMVTTSYVSDEMEVLDKTCRKKGIVILNEIGEDPGLDNMSVKGTIDQVREAGGEVSGVLSYGAGLPAFEHNNNPMGYKFSWRPKGVILAAQTPASYIEKGKVVNVPGKNLFDHCRLVDLAGVGSFEAYPNRDCRKYVECFQLNNKASFFRGILRNIGWCVTMKGLADLKLLDDTGENDFANTTYAGFTAMLIGEDDTDRIVEKTARFLKVDERSDLIKKLKWLGLFDEREVNMVSGSNADILVEMMTRRMSYAPMERDMVILHNEITAKFPQKKEKRMSTLLVRGEPGGESAMSRAVSLPAAIASRLILEGKIEERGVLRPTAKGIYQPVLEEMENFGFCFTDSTQRIT
jgi:saccharopine dehydrogenase-like NADP-dependent oxidoreductase